MRAKKVRSRDGERPDDSRIRIPLQATVDLISVACSAPSEHYSLIPTITRQPTSTCCLFPANGAVIYNKMTTYINNYLKWNDKHILPK